MKKMVCPRCGSPNAADFVFTILCPEKACAYYDAKLAEERAAESDELDYELSWLDELDLQEYDFVAGPDFVLDLSDLDDVS